MQDIIRKFRTELVGFMMMMVMMLRLCCELIFIYGDMRYVSKYSDCLPEGCSNLSWNCVREHRMPCLLTYPLFPKTVRALLALHTQSLVHSIICCQTNEHTNSVPYYQGKPIPPFCSRNPAHVNCDAYYEGPIHSWHSPATPSDQMMT